MIIAANQDVWFDDAATSAMGEAFAHACKTLGNFESGASVTIADLIIQAARNGGRDPSRLYEHVSKNFGVEDGLMPVPHTAKSWLGR